MSVRERTELEVLEKQPEDPSVGGIKKENRNLVMSSGPTQGVL